MYEKDSQELNDLFKKTKFKISSRQQPPIHSETIPPVSFKGCTQWSTEDDIKFRPVSHTVSELIPGVYEIGCSDSGLYFTKIPIRTEGVLQFPDSKSSAILEEISKFWEREPVFKQYGFTHKRGILLWGPPGSGKSCTIQLIIDDVVKRNGVVLRFTQPSIFMNALRDFRKIQPDTPVVVTMEDIDSIIKNFSESEVLNIIDGIHEIDKIVFLATTNYPEQLGARIINRPSRFDKRFKIGMPNFESRKIYFNYLFKGESNGYNIDKWAKDTVDFSIAHLKELFVAVVILGDNYIDALETLRNMKEPIEDESNQNIGFVQNNGCGYEEPY